MGGGIFVDEALRGVFAFTLKDPCRPTLGLFDNLLEAPNVQNRSHIRSKASENAGNTKIFWIITFDILM